MHLCFVAEDNINRVLPDAGGGQMLMILNTARSRYIGRSFGVAVNGQAENQFIGVIGTFCDEPDEVELLPSQIYSFEDRDNSADCLLPAYKIEEATATRLCSCFFDFVAISAVLVFVPQ